MEIDAKYYNDLLAENQRLRKAVERQDRLRQKLKALRKEVRRLNRWREIFAAGQKDEQAVAELAQTILRRSYPFPGLPEPTAGLTDLPVHKRFLTPQEIAGTWGAPLDGGNGTP